MSLLEQLIESCDDESLNYWHNKFEREVRQAEIQLASFRKALAAVEAEEVKRGLLEPTDYANEHTYDRT